MIFVLLLIPFYKTHFILKLNVKEGLELKLLFLHRNMAAILKHQMQYESNLHPFDLQQHNHYVD